MTEEAVPLEESPEDDDGAVRREWIKARRACTPKQRIWMDKLSEHDNQRWAALYALGYSKHTLHKWLRQPKFLKALALHDEVALRAAGRSAAEVISVVWDTVDRCRQAVPVLDKFGKPVLIENAEGKWVPAYVFDAKSVLNGAELLAKFHKLLSDRHELTGKDGAPLNLAPPVLKVTVVADDPEESTEPGSAEEAEPGLPQ